MAYNSINDVNKILEKYFNDITDDIDKETLLIAKEGTQALKNESNTYHIRTGKYNKGWRFKIEKKYGNIEATIYNATNYQLTHLLENGHRIITRNGLVKGNVKAYPHITPESEKLSSKYERDIEKIINFGG